MVFEWQNRKEKEQKRHENWWIKVCNKITMESNFPNDEIIEMYICDNHGQFPGMFNHSQSLALSVDGILLL